MSKAQFCTIVATDFLCGAIISTNAAGQQGVFQHGGHKLGVESTKQPSIAFLDVGRVLEQNSRLKAQKQRLIAEMKQADEKLIERQKAIRRLQQQLRELCPGTQQHEEIGKEVSQLLSQLKVDLKFQQKVFSEKRAQMLQRAYREVERDVREVAKKHGFTEVWWSEHAYAGPLAQVSPDKRFIFWVATPNITDEVLEQIAGRTSAQDRNEKMLGPGF